MQRRRVVFPQPLGPSRKKISPGSIRRLIRFKATVSPKRLTRFSIDREIMRSQRTARTLKRPRQNARKPFPGTLLRESDKSLAPSFFLAVPARLALLLIANDPPRLPDRWRRDCRCKRLRRNPRTRQKRLHHAGRQRSFAPLSAAAAL